MTSARDRAIGLLTHYLGLAGVPIHDPDVRAEIEELVDAITEATMEAQRVAILAARRVAP